MRTKLLVVCILLVMTSMAQEEKIKRRPEVFFNVSNALVRATGNSGTSLVIDEPYLIGLKLTSGENKAFRMGTNFNFRTTQDFTDNNFIRTTTELLATANIGWEWRRPLSEKFTYYFGLDARYHTNKSTTDAQTANGNQLISSHEQGPGGSPFFGIVWHITDRVALFTESHIVADGVLTQRFLQDENGIRTTLEDSWALKVRPIPPGAIYVTIKL